MIASAATASDITSHNNSPTGVDKRESVGDPPVIAPEEFSRMVDAAARMDSNSFRAISSFQAGSCCRWRHIQVSSSMVTCRAYNGCFYTLRGNTCVKGDLMASERKK